MESKTQKCPHCGKTWKWNNNRWVELYHTGRLYLTCKGCGEKFLAYEDKKRLAAT